MINPDYLEKEFEEYVKTCVLSRRPANKTDFIIGKSAADSYISFVKTEKLFSYNPSKWAHVKSIFEISSSDKILEIIDVLFNDEDFTKVDNEGTSQYFRSNAIKQYYCFLKAREVFMPYSKQDSYTLKNPDALPLQQIYYGAPGTGKSHTINEKTEGESVIRTTFHPDSDYSTFVGAYKPTTKEVPLRDVTGKVVTELNTETGKVEKVIEDRIVYEFVEQAFLQAYIKTWEFIAENSDEPKKQYLVIEEINRGNCAQIFGDLFQLLDRNDCGFSDYPINADKDMKKQLKKAFNGLVINNADTINACFKGRDVVKEVLNGDILLLPNNLYIWATMNTSDQSLFPIDSAFKRRWDWQYMPIAPGRDNAGNLLAWTIDVNGNKYSWWSFLEKINAQIGEATQSEDKKLGFFFCKAVNGVISPETFVGKVIFYLWNDVFKDYGFEGAIFKDVDGTELSFGKFYKSDMKGNAIIQKDKVELFLENLGVEMIFVNNDTQEKEDELIEFDDNGNETNESSRIFDRSKYSINGEGEYGKGKVAYEAIKVYIANNPQKDSNEIVDDWLSLGVAVPNFVETENMFDDRTSSLKDSRLKARVNIATLANGEIIYVSNQYNVERVTDFISKINNKNWGITIAKLNK